MYVLPKLKLILMLPPKNASRAIADLARQHGGKQSCGHHEVDAQGLHRRRKDGFKSVLVVRNPFRRTVSWYWHKVNSRQASTRRFNNKSLTTVLQNYGRMVDGRPAHDSISLRDYLRHPVDVFVRFEHLPDDLEDLGLDATGLREVGRSKTRLPWWPEYTPNAERWVRRLCRRDFKYLDGIYSQNVIDIVEPAKRQQFITHMRQSDPNYAT